jgi:acyl-coenzyme A thioesterase PaaI-like protein
MGSFAFDDDTLVSGADGSFMATVTDRWAGTGGVVNGGYLMAICTRALGLVMPFPHPLVISVLELGAASVTIQLTVHLRAVPAPGWLACRATTR